jgi:hypothetical protein
MAIARRMVVICDICGWMTSATELTEEGNNVPSWATATDKDNYKSPDNWTHGKEGLIDICPRCTTLLKHQPAYNKFNYRRDNREDVVYNDAN